MSPPADPRSARLARQKRTLHIACAVLILGAILLLTLPGPIPLPLRLILAAFDLVAAATLWLVSRQKFSGK